MRIGFNLLLWTAHVQREHWGILDALKACGYDGVEIPIFEGTPDHYAQLGRHLETIGLAATGIAVIPSLDLNPIGADPKQREAAVAHMDWVIQCTAAAGATLVGGPLHSTLGHFTGAAVTEDERARGRRLSPRRRRHRPAAWGRCRPRGGETGSNVIS